MTTTTQPLKDFGEGCVYSDPLPMNQPDDYNTVVTDILYFVADYFSDEVKDERPPIMSLLLDLTKYQVLLWLISLYPSISTSSDPMQYLTEEDAPESRPEDHWARRQQREDMELRCTRVHPNARDIVKRFYAILPYFDRDHTNVDFLHKFRGTVQQMSLGDDMLDREAAFFAAALTPVIFMQRYRDIWCLMERFHRALRLYQISHPSEKRSSLKLLQNLRGVNQKIRQFIMTLPRPQTYFNLPANRFHTSDPFDEADLPDKKDIRFLKELVKNLG